MTLLKRKVLTTQNQFPISKVKTENDSEIVNELSGNSKITRSFKVLFRKPQAKKVPFQRHEPLTWALLHAYSIKAGMAMAL
jgi:hypothetical protein